MFHAFLHSADFFFENYYFKKILSGMTSSRQTVRSQIRPDIVTITLKVISRGH